MEKRANLTIEIIATDMEASARVAQKAVLQEIYLVDAKINRQPVNISPEVLTLEHKCSTEPVSEGDKPFSILCNFQVTAFSDKSPNKSVMKIEATFCTDFSIPDDLFPEFRDDLEKHNFKKFRIYCDYFWKANPISTAWPYWREFVQNMSARMGFPALTVPLLEIVPKKPEEKAKEDSGKKASKRRKKVSA